MRAQSPTDQISRTAGSPPVKTATTASFLCWYPEVRGHVCLPAWTECRLTKLGFHVGATGERDKKPLLELDLMTVRPLLPLALSCRYDRTKPAKGHGV